MPAIPNYTKTVIRQRATPNTVDPGAIGRAAAPFEGVAKLADAGFDIVKAEQDAHKATKLNESVVKYKKDLTLLDKDLREQNMMTPEGYSALFEEESEKLKKSYMETFGYKDVEAQFKQTADEVNLRGFDSALTWQRTRGAEVALERTNDALSDIYDRAYAGVDLGDVFNDVERSVDAAGTLIKDPIKLENLSEGAREQAITYAIEGALSRKQMSLARSLNAKHKKELGAIKSGELSTVIQREQDRIDAKIKQEKLIGFKEDVKKIEAAASMGWEIPSEDIDNLIQVSASLGQKATARSLISLRDNQQYLSEYSQLPFREQIAESERIMSEQNIDDVGKARLVNSFLKTKMQGISADPLQYYADSKQIEINPLDFSNPETVKYELQNRMVSKAQISEKEGVKVPLLTKTEADRLSQVYQGGSIGDRSSLIQTLTMTLPEEEKSSIGAIISKGSPSMAVGLMVSKFDPNTTEKIISGGLQEKFVAKKTFEASLQEELEGAIPDPAALDSVTDSIYDLYAQLSFEENDSSNILDTGRMNKAIKKIIGEPIEVNNGFFGKKSTTIPFRLDNGQFITEDQFEAIIEDLNLEKVLETHGDTFKTPEGTNLDVQDTLSRSRFVAAGGGGYELHTSSGAQAMDSSGAPFLLNMKKIAQDASVKTLLDASTRGLSSHSLNRYVDLEAKKSDLIDSNAPQSEIDAVNESLRKLRITGSIKSIKEGF